MNNRDVFISNSIILASTFCRTRGLDLCGLNVEPSNYCAVPAEVPWSQVRKLERSPTKFNIYMIDISCKVNSPIFSEGIYAFDIWGIPCLWMQLFKLAIRRNLPQFSLIDTRLWKTKHPRKRFRNFHQSCVLLTDRIEIHQSQPDSMT